MFVSQALTVFFGFSLLQSPKIYSKRSGVYALGLLFFEVAQDLFLNFDYSSKSVRTAINMIPLQHAATFRSQYEKRDAVWRNRRYCNRGRKAMDYLTGPNTRASCCIDR